MSGMFLKGWIAAGLLALAACSGDNPTDDADVTPEPGAGVATLQVKTLSTQADRISGGDVLLQVSPVPDEDALSATRDGESLPLQRRNADDTAAHWLLSGLAEGENRVELRARIGGVAHAATLVLINHPRSGPVLSGPQQQPFFCRTIEAGLGEPLDADCAAPTQVTYLYKRKRLAGLSGLAPLQSLDEPYPSDLDETTTTDGRRVPFVVRVESGTINRSVYRIAVLDDPLSRGPTDPYVPTAGWNRRLIYSFGGGCGSGLHQGGGAGSYARIDEAALPWIMADGYAQIVSSLTELGTSCNDVLSAETAMMVKEHFVEHYGVPIWTMGRGGSGGSIQQHMIAQNYPGLLDGLVVKGSFPDNTSLLPEVQDCRLLRRVFATRPLAWNASVQARVSGFATANVCKQWGDGFVPVIADPWLGCPAELPREAIYDPVSNPRGVRCTVPDTQRNLYGVDPQTGFAPSPYDNEGVQYGLQPLREGRLSPELFIALNRDIGGLDIDGNWQPQRTQASVSTLRTAYRSGRVTQGDALGRLPVLDINFFADRIPGQNIHDRIRPFTMRERIRNAHGDAQTHVMWTYNFTGLIYQPFVRPAGDGAGIDTMRDWLDTLVARPARERADVIASKPDTARDRCVIADGLPPIYAEAGAPGVCETTFPTSLTPRLVAGAPLANDVLKCRLKPIDAADYGAAASRFSDADLQELREIFPDGVCDYSLAGVEQVAPIAPWLDYAEPFPQQPGFAEDIAAR